MVNMSEIPFPRGVRDLKPNEAIFRNEVLHKIAKVFELFGFYPIDTPSFEHLSVLKAKNAIGEDNKLIFELAGGELGLRYDHTVSLARYMGMHKELALPFKRYYIGKVWRREEPQRLRTREFTQADVDIVGGKKIFSEAEVIATASVALDSLGMDYLIKISDRRILEGALEAFGIDKSLFTPIERVVDKLEKIGAQKLSEMLSALNLDRQYTDKIMELLGFEGTNKEKLARSAAIVKDSAAVNDMSTLLSLLEAYGIKGEVIVDFSIVRGLDYYTGTIFEYKYAKEPTGPSICSGGRYDGLTSLYGAPQLPAVGFGIGIDRILEYMNFSASIMDTYATVFIACINDTNYLYALNVATKLRASGINTDMNVAAKNLSNQFAYANALNIKYIVVIGDEEQKSGNIKLRNLVNGEESALSVEDAIKTMKAGT